MQKTVERFGLSTAKEASTPLEVGANILLLTRSACTDPYREAIGVVMYLMIGTRPDIAFAVRSLAKFAENISTGQ